MKLALLGPALLCATLSFGQSSLQIQSPSGTVSLSATSISGSAADKERALLDHLRLAVLQQQLTHLEAVYSPESPNVKQLQSEIRVVEAAARLSDISVTSKNDNGIIQLKRNVEIKTDTMTLTADEADYHPSTGEIEPRGTVRVKLNSK